MSDTPKFTVIDRRKMKAEEEQENPRAAESQPVEATPPAASGGGPRLVVSEPKREEPPAEAAAVGEELELPPAPTAEESREQKAAYDDAVQRLEDILRSQNPGMDAPPVLGFEHLVQQFYVSAMIQLGAGTQEGQRPRMDIVGARNTIDMLGVLAEKTRGNLSEAEDRALQTVLFEVRMAFMELTRMISLQALQQAPPPPSKR